MVIFVLAMVITILMTIASTLKVVFRSSENSFFRRRCTHGECTDKLQKAKSPRAMPEHWKCIFMQYQKNLYDTCRRVPVGMGGQKASRPTYTDKKRLPDESGSLSL